MICKTQSSRRAWVPARKLSFPEPWAPTRRFAHYFSNRSKSKTLLSRQKKEPETPAKESALEFELSALLRPISY